jgi:septal ring factor EnvC (AmiA/AmiB activator)
LVSCNQFVQRPASATQQLKTLELHLADKEAWNTILREQLAMSNIKESELKNQLRKLELEVATANAKVGAQQGIVAELRTYTEYHWY